MLSLELFDPIVMKLYGLTRTKTVCNAWLTLSFSPHALRNLWTAPKAKSLGFFLKFSWKTRKILINIKNIPTEIHQIPSAFLNVPSPPHHSHPLNPSFFLAHRQYNPNLKIQRKQKVHNLISFFFISENFCYFLCRQRCFQICFINLKNKKKTHFR